MLFRSHPKDQHSDADEAVEVVRQRRRVSDATRWADEWYNDHYNGRSVFVSLSSGTPWYEGYLGTHVKRYLLEEERQREPHCIARLVIDWHRE